MSSTLRPVLILAGGVSAEHEVSIITGLQVVEKIDRTRYTPHFIYIRKDGKAMYIPHLQNRKKWRTCKQIPVAWGQDAYGPYVQVLTFLRSRIYPIAAYLAFHGGTGEGGSYQGFFQSLGIPATSCSVEGSAITMNKLLTKEVLAAGGIPVVPYMRIFSTDLSTASSEEMSHEAVKRLSLPVIVKPAHLGSSIGIKVARTVIELEKALLEAASMDSEILIEKYLPAFTEYNCAVRKIHGSIETSEIERPLSSHEILSFADKYQRGGKKTGASGMASLQRELPAKISSDIKILIQSYARTAFALCRCQSMVRIDFMTTPSGELYLTEINSIPGSMAFYLWEASGITFKQQITDMIEQAVHDATAHKTKRLDYASDIVEKFAMGV